MYPRLASKGLWSSQRYPWTPDLPECWGYRYVLPYPISRVPGDWTQDFVHTRHTHYQLSYTHSPPARRWNPFSLPSFFCRMIGLAPGLLQSPLLSKCALRAQSVSGSHRPSWFSPTGLGYCFSFLPTVTILSQYFDKRRSVVTAVASTGECFAVFAFAPGMWVTVAHWLGIGEASLVLLLY